MIPKTILPILGRMDALTYSIPVVGEELVRSKSRLLGALLYHLPLVGGRKSQTVGELRSQWLAFLERFGIFATVSREDEQEFHWSIAACAYAFSDPKDTGVCDACMDLDRAYTHLLGGELEIVETIPGGSNRCCFITRLSRPASSL